jgi:LPXTG-site transpeptidase (sortase) family protein
MQIKLLKRPSIISAFLIIFAIIFYLLNFDISNIGRFINGSVNLPSQEKYGIPNVWLEKYDIQVENEKDLQQDLDNDGLTILAEYKYATNPQEADTDKDGYSDGAEIKAGYNPIGAGRLDLDKDTLPDIWEEEFGLSVTANDYALDQDNDGLPNYLELRHGTNPQKADTDEDGFDDSNEIRNGYDPSKKGDARPSYKVIITKINVDAPVLWSVSTLEADLQEDLKKGVVRYPQTGIPGQAGNVVTTGHSSNYIWSDGEYNYIFKDLNNLQAGDEIVITATQANGKTLEYKYKVTNKEVVSPDDQRIFEETSKQNLTIVTCWPLNTDWKRLMLQTEQIN